MHLCPVRDREPSWLALLTKAWDGIWLVGSAQLGFELLPCFSLAPWADPFLSFLPSWPGRKGFSQFYWEGDWKSVAKNHRPDTESGQKREHLRGADAPSLRRADLGKESQLSPPGGGRMDQIWVDFLQRQWAWWLRAPALSSILTDLGSNPGCVALGRLLGLSELQFSDT